MSKIKIRAANREDVDLLFSWVNDPESMSAKLKTRQPISKENHDKWFEERLRDKDTGIWIGEIDNRPIGQVRLQLDQGMMEIDVFVASDYRNLGAARFLIDYAAARHAENWPDRQIFARIRHENFPSKHLFLKGGYKLNKVQNDHVILILSAATDWWKRKRKIQLIVDNPSWIIGHVQELAEKLSDLGDQVTILNSYDSSQSVDINFLLGCTKLAPPEFLSQARLSLCVHESELPLGKGFSPLTWQIIEGQNVIPVNLFYAIIDGDAGPVVYREKMTFEGHELIDEMREVQGNMTIDMCMRYLSEEIPPLGDHQVGEPSCYRRRKPEDSQLDPNQSLAAQFDQLRVVDNNRYPAYFYLRGKKYSITIEKLPSRSN